MKLKDLLTNPHPLSLNTAALIGRIVVGAYFIKHGHEFFDSAAMNKFSGYLSNELHFPMPMLMAYLRTGAELFGGIMLVLGIFTRIGAFLIMFTMLIATFTAGKGDIIGEAEMTVVYAMFCLVIILMGSGKYSLDNYLFNKNKV